MCWGTPVARRPGARQARLNFGLSIPSGGPNATPEVIATIARRGEELGFAYTGVSDHVVIPRDIRSRYPYSESGEFGGRDDILDQLTVVSFLAAQTSRIRLLTSVMVLPHRSPVLAAKMLASIDVLSAGRLTVGCGVGWMREEFEAIDAPPFDERGAVSDEYIRCLRELWTSDDPSFDGEYVRFSDITFEPKPVQKPCPPIWIGGESPAALRRAGELGDGWYPIGNNPRFPMGTVQHLANALDTIHRHADRVGRDPSQIDVAYSAGWYDDRGTQTGPDGARRSFTGTEDQVTEDIRAFGEAGVRHLMVGMRGRSVADTLERMEHFATSVAPRVNS